MKNIVKYSLITLSLLFAAIPVAAGVGDVEGIVVSKKLSKKENTPGLYTIRLETYVTGASSTVVTEVTEPIDIVMVIDRSVATNAAGLNSQVVTAAKEFVKTVYDLNPTTGPGHKLAMCSFGGGSTIYHHIDFPLEQITETKRDEMVARIESIGTGGDDWKGRTCSDESLVDAYDILNAVKDDGRKKVVLFFTAGAPKNEDSGGGSSAFDPAAGVRAVNAAHNLKAGLGAKVYSVLPANVVTSGSIKKADELAWRDIPRFCHYISSNYDYTMTDYTYNFRSNFDSYANPGGEEVAHDYFRTCSADGADLSVIFNKIAEESTSGGSSFKLTAESCAVIDVMTSNFNFYIPDGATKVDVRCWPETCVEFNTLTKTGVSWVKEGEEGFDYTPDVDEHGNPVEITADISGNKLTVTGFNYSKDDQTVSAGVTSYGNWVGVRTKTGTVGVTKGNKLVVEFDVMLAEGYFEGMDLPSNDITSGVYYDTDDDGTPDMIVPYPVPVEHFPAICIMKDGLLPGESALFEVSGPDGFSMTVALKQKQTKNGALIPCYAIVSTPKMGEYTVTEKNWAWTYDRPASMTKTLGLIMIPTGTKMSRREFIIARGEPLSNNGTEVGLSLTQGDNSYCILLNAEGDDYEMDDPELYVNSSIQLLFHFTNTPAKDGKPANDEAAVHNVFAGGSNTSGGTETGDVEEDSWD